MSSYSGYNVSPQGKKPKAGRMSRKRMNSLIEPFLVRNGSTFTLKRVNPDDTGGFRAEKADAEKALEDGIGRLRALQEKLYAQDQWGVLLIFQAMDAAGKDGVIEHVMTGVNPQGCDVTSFKQPSSEELDHDFLWRTVKRLPERGRIGIFNRSYYEEVLIVRVHPELLTKQKLPRSLDEKDVFAQRYEDINAHERYLARNGFLIRKFFLHISKDEQTRRFRKRIEDPEKNWKFSLGDLHEQERWPDYMDAYESAIRQTATAHAPWIVVPANQKWFARLVVATAVIEALEELDLAFPPLSADRRRELEAGRKRLSVQVNRARGGRGPRNT
jgi:PPK2 family polyphosphate:nucleotide phosphotransferase